MTPSGRPSPFRTVQASAARGGGGVAASPKAAAEQRMHDAVTTVRAQMRSSSSTSGATPVSASSSSGGTAAAAAVAPEVIAVSSEDGNDDATPGRCTGASASSRVSSRPKKKRKAEVRRHFAERKTDKGEMLSCLECEKRDRKTYYSLTTSCGHLKAHIEKEHPKVDQPEGGTAAQRTIRL
eukprot:GHVU01101938.1.p2 GENE.GHVU01101938.1~~GHVU01101938.1.p2  ORF type:complete len:181 (+),score=22.06 GHVU01101938.1:275-817(+)